jgi:hypothetical protein
VNNIAKYLTPEVGPHYRKPQKSWVVALDYKMHLLYNPIIIT